MIFNNKRITELETIVTQLVNVVNEQTLYIQSLQSHKTVKGFNNK